MVPGGTQRDLLNQEANNRTLATVQKNSRHDMAASEAWNEVQTESSQPETCEASL